MIGDDECDSEKCQVRDENGGSVSGRPAEYSPVDQRRDRPEQKQYIAFEGKCLELAIPLKKLGITGDEPVGVTLKEF